MGTIETTCTRCKHSNICKYNSRAMEISSTIKNKYKTSIDGPFSIELKCEYRIEKVSNPRTRTVGI